MPAGRPEGLSIDAFIALMAEMGVEAVLLPEGEPEVQDNAMPASDATTG